MKVMTCVLLDIKFIVFVVMSLKEDSLLSNVQSNLIELCKCYSIYKHLLHPSNNKYHFHFEAINNFAML